MKIFRIRVLIEISDDVPRLHPVHGPLIYALLAEANGAGLGLDSSCVDNRILVDAPEQLRVALNIGEPYAFGATLICESEEDAWKRVNVLRSGLEILSSQGRPEKRNSLDRNFRLSKIEDLVKNETLDENDFPVAISRKHIEDEISRIDSQKLELVFETPLRWLTPKSVLNSSKSQRGRPKFPKFFNRDYFDAKLFLERLPARFRELGFEPQLGKVVSAESAETISNKLGWLDTHYRGTKKKPPLGGCVGRIVISVPDSFPKELLVLAQYTHVGSATRFGLGRFRIACLGGNPFACSRSMSLLNLSMQTKNLDTAAKTNQQDTIEVRKAGSELVNDSYQCQPPQQIPIESIAGKKRELSIPHPVDRTLQRAVLQVIGPGLDNLFESSSTAYRPQKGRFYAAKRIRNAYNAGYRWALKTDFENFFGSISHEELKIRLAAYVSDPKLEQRILKWVTAGSSKKEGIVLGAPLSPLISNLFLDRFDEQIRDSEGRLVRYADDFLILFKDVSDAKRAWEMSDRAARELKLSLNTDKTSWIDLGKPFHFLGFKFEHRETWVNDDGSPPVHLDDIGWIDESKNRPRYAPKMLLPGESKRFGEKYGSILIVDQDTTWIGVRDKRICIQRAGRNLDSGPAVDNVSQIVMLDSVTLDESLVAAIRDHGIDCVVSDRGGRARFEIRHEENDPSAKALMSQVDSSKDQSFCLKIAKKLVEAKLNNYSVLADAFPQMKPSDTARKIRSLKGRIIGQTSLASLSGIEGVAAAAWYDGFAKALPSKFYFYRRVSPKASDPVNVMLNIAHTHLYRQCKLAIRSVGLNPNIGFFHQPSPGHAALASDVQEPFRMLMDRAVIETCYKISPADFDEVDSGYFPLKMSFNARRRLFSRIYQAFFQPVSTQASEGGDLTDSCSYRLQLLRMMRNLKSAALSQDETKFVAMRLPTSVTPKKSQ